MVSSKRELENS